MKIARFVHEGRAEVGLVEDGSVRPLGASYSAVAEVIVDPQGARSVAAAAKPIPLAQVSLRAPVDGSSRVFAVAQNYKDHAQETSGTDVPPAPIVFLKPVSALVGDGPWIVSRDELEGNLDDLGLRCHVNGERVQDDRTSSMVRGIAELASFISRRVALQPGDLIATGTPGGVGRARGVNLKDGDLVEVEIDGIGVLRNRVTVTR
jgi:2-keto-4-pentenoate hydratase/2-oxohepta-3-ene-1,7-dioic acid hydratase in catechol pathway